MKVPAGKPSIIAGIPLSEEPGLGPLTLAGYIRDVTDRHGPREAAVMPDGDEMVRWTYSDLWDRSMAVARALMACGVGKGARVGVLMTNRLEFLSAVFGTALAGGTAATLSTFSTPTELDHLLQSSACSVLLFERHVLKKDFTSILCELEPHIDKAAPGALQSFRYPFLRHLVVVDAEGKGAIEGWNEFLARGRAIAPALVDAAAATVRPSDPAVLFFSSGSTSKPKGILSANRGVALQLWRWRRWFGVEDEAPVRCWSANGFFWSGNFAMALGAALSSGGMLVLQQTFQPDEALTLMERERANLPLAWPHQWAQLETASNWKDVDLSAMHYVAGDTPIGRHPSVSTSWTDPRHAYGNTETFTLSTVFPANTSAARAGGSHGEPAPGNSIKIVDPLTGAVMPLGERGEIAVKGPTLMLGYLGVPLDETLDAEGFFHTGDGGYVDEAGRLFWEGRLNDIIKTGGANVSPVEIDSVLAQCPGVKVTQTVGIPHDTLGELVVACIVPHESAALDEEGVRAFAKEQLASYKVPRRVLFFSEDELKMTGSAKVKTSDLRQLAAKKLDAEATG